MFKRKRTKYDDEQYHKYVSDLQDLYKLRERADFFKRTKESENLTQIIEIAELTLLEMQAR